MKHSDSISNLATALVAAQKNIKAVAKDSVNPHFRNRYASLDAMVESVRPTLAAHGLAVVQGATSPITDSDGALCGFAVETMLLHASGEWLLNSAIMPLSKVDAQGAGGAMTYGRRYGLSALLALATEDDDDGHSAGQAQPRATAAPRSAATNASNGASTARGAVTVKVMPFGKTKGKALKDLPPEELEKTLAWATKTDEVKFKDLIASIEAELNTRSLGIRAPLDNQDEYEFPESLRDSSDGLPF